MKENIFIIELLFLKSEDIYRKKLKYDFGNECNS
jgi:hypothetical protein